jgi:flagellar hook-associated protein 1 FlgK
VDSKAVIENGKITFKPTDTNGDGAVSNYPLVKDDGSLLFKAFNEIEYLPLDKINTTELPIPLENGSFDIVAYDNDGNELARRTITVDMNSTDPKYSTIEGIIAQINTSNIDDNQDNNSQNDIDDYFKASIVGGKFTLSPKKDNIYVGLDNDSVNIGGAFGINKFFDGKDAFTISLRQDLAENPGKIHAYKAPSEGNNEVANEILQLQFEKIKFYKNGEAVEDTIFGFYRSSTSALANEVENTKNNKEVSDTLLKNISDQYYALTGVNIDEELINLERFQRGYQANAKVITTINQMLDALFGIKQ